MKSGVRETGTILDSIVESVSFQLEQRKQTLPLKYLVQRVSPVQSTFVESLRKSDFAIIAECKRSSPSEGVIAEEEDLLERAQKYAADGAAAVSVLTEQDHFGGCLADLARVSECGIPRLRKDFIIDEYMLYEAAHLDADAVLLLANCLEDELLMDLRQTAHGLGLAVLLEVHDQTELLRALPMQPECIGVNARNLKSFEVDLAVCEELLPQIGNEFVKIAESGIHEWSDLQRVRDAGANAILCGTALMKDSNKLKNWVGKL